MKRLRRCICSLLVMGSLLVSTTSSAEVLLLVHGYLSGAETWQSSGVMTQLDQHGWQRGGVLLATPQGLRTDAARIVNVPDKVYTLDLPSERPVNIQAGPFQQALDYLVKAYPDDSISIVAHSAGAIVARYAMVVKPVPQVKRLITIAAPHMGTPRAQDGLTVTNVPFPISPFTSFFGGKHYRALQRSTGLLVDLTPPRPGNLLYWLNGRLHPDIEYISIVRAGDGGNDLLVPISSQDMNNVPALRGKSRAVIVGTGHELNPLDGKAIIDILMGIRQTRDAFSDMRA